MGLAKRQSSVMAALEMAAHPHHTEANLEMVAPVPIPQRAKSEPASASCRHRGIER
jgi:hypothetical protein